jgi:hypothetical protein
MDDKYRNISWYEDTYRQIIWNNIYIQIEGKLINYKEWKNKK